MCVNLNGRVNFGGESRVRILDLGRIHKRRACKLFEEGGAFTSIQIPQGHASTVKIHLLNRYIKIYSIAFNPFSTGTPFCHEFLVRLDAFINIRKGL